MISVPDGASIAAARWCSSVTGRLVGGSTGTEIWGALRLVAGMRSRGETGSVVTLLCDGGERYAHTYYDDGWLAEPGHRHRAVHRDPGEVRRHRGVGRALELRAQSRRRLSCRRTRLSD